MKLKSILLSDLSTNKSNDRHGELIDEDAAIEWLLKHRADHMRNLTKDIVQEGQIYEPPLVHVDDDGRAVVFDGNRRVTCLKLLNSPQNAPTGDWQKFFKEQRKLWVGSFPKKIPCHVEEDRDRIDEILFRRHTGGQSGVGQSQWDAEAKSHFVRRTGKKTSVNLAEEIEEKLKEHEYLGANAKVPRSNLLRLLSSEGLRNRVGISVQKQHVEVTHEDGKVLSALHRIVDDLIQKEVTLDDIWSNSDKKRYLDRLEKEGVLPTAADALEKHKNLKTLKVVEKKQKGNRSSKKTASSKDRKSLIRPEDGDDLTSKSHTKRAIDIWNELQYHLKFGKHDNAIAVLFRVLLELSIGNYIARVKVLHVKETDNLGQRFKKVLDHMLSQGEIDKKYHEGLAKFQQREHLLSANTMNKYVHHSHFFPSDLHLKSMWDSLSQFIEICLKK
ncbi:MAG: hypothetical protein KAH11_10665 [Rhodospirillales bacterium]|nr:hypothetical protein [Rhodospirillales bacterium]